MIHLLNIYVIFIFTLMWPQAPTEPPRSSLRLSFSKASVLCSLNDLVFIVIMISLSTDSSHGDPFLIECPLRVPFASVVNVVLVPGKEVASSVRRRVVFRLPARSITVSGILQRGVFKTGDVRVISHQWRLSIFLNLALLVLRAKIQARGG